MLKKKGIKRDVGWLGCWVILYGTRGCIEEHIPCWGASYRSLGAGLSVRLEAFYTASACFYKSRHT